MKKFLIIAALFTFVGGGSPVIGESTSPSQEEKSTQTSHSGLLSDHHHHPSIHPKYPYRHCYHDRTGHRRCHNVRFHPPIANTKAGYNYATTKKV